MKAIGLALVTFGLASAASAHFVWAEFRPEGGRHVSIGLGEGLHEDVLPVLGKLATKIQVYGAYTGKPTERGAYLDFALSQPTSATVVYIPYGPFTRAGEPVWLDYFAKAVDSPTDAGRVVGKGFEIVAIPDAEGWTATALLDGKPAKDAVIVLGDEKNETKSAPGQSMKIPLNGASLQLRANREFDRAGIVDGKSYKKVKQWTSIVLPPLPVVSAGSDADAYRALELASESRETLRPGTQPWAVSFEATNGQDKLKGEAAWSGKGAPTVTFPMEENGYTKHVRGQLASLFMHRMTGDFGQGDGKSVITWTNDTNELGRQMLVKDRFDSSYRLKDGQIRQVVRTIGKRRLTLDILDVQATSGGRYLSKRYRALERDPKTGELQSELMYTDEFRLVSGEWLPASRTVKGTHEDEKLFMQVRFGQYRKAMAPVGTK